MRFALQQVASALGLSTGLSAEIAGWSIDTRTLEPGDLFFALRGPVHDGNGFIAQALAAGAGAVIAERAAEGAVLRVPDTLAALKTVAGWARAQWGGEVVGVTGSAGKTSTKDVIAALLGVRLRVGKTVGNFNNHAGLPISILRLPGEAEVAVLELGMNHAGEIRELARIARPRVGVVTNVGYAHIEFFESIEGIAAAKGELVEALPAEGMAVLNADDPLVARLGDRHSGRTITFGLSEEADVRAEAVESLRDGTRFRVQDVGFETRLTGAHSVRNILAGIAVAAIYGIRPEELREAVAALEPGKMRGERSRYHDIEILNDCYNSNPEAAKAMIGALREIPAKRHIAVLGEMLELGRWSERLHRDVGSYAAQSGMDVLVGIRGAARAMADAAMDAGLPADAAFFFEDPIEAGRRLGHIARAGDAVLFKGSRGTHVERSLDAFLATLDEQVPAAQGLS